METSNSKPKKIEQFYRVFFRKKRGRYKIMYKDISAYSYSDAIEIASDYVRNTNKGKNLVLISE